LLPLYVARIQRTCWTCPSNFKLIALLLQDVPAAAVELL
jgi:hypothetical protein